MSHTTAIKSVPIKDIAALKRAVADLQSEGIKCELVEGQRPRMYYKDQHGICDYVLKLPGSYDVGFDKQKDGTYAPVFDSHANHVGKHLAASCPMPNTAEGRQQHHIGKLMQGYSKYAAINAAVKAGYIVQGTTTDADGKIHLTLGGMR